MAFTIGNYLELKKRENIIQSKRYSNSNDWVKYFEEYQKIFFERRKYLIDAINMYPNDKIWAILNAREFGEIASNFNDDKDIVMISIKNNGYSFLNASTRLKNDREVAFQAALNTNIKDIIGEFSSEIRNDKNFIAILALYFAKLYEDDFGEIRDSLNKLISPDILNSNEVNISRRNSSDFESANGIVGRTEGVNPYSFDGRIWFDNALKKMDEFQKSKKHK